MNFKNLSPQDIKFMGSPLVIGLSIFIYLVYTLPVIILTYLKWGELGNRPTGILIMFYGWGAFSTIVASVLLFSYLKVRKLK